MCPQLLEASLKPRINVEKKEFRVPNARRTIGLGLRKTING